MSNPLYFSARMLHDTTDPKVERGSIKHDEENGSFGSDASSWSYVSHSGPSTPSRLFASNSRSGSLPSMSSASSSMSYCSEPSTPVEHIHTSKALLYSYPHTPVIHPSSTGYVFSSPSDTLPSYYIHMDGQGLDFDGDLGFNTATQCTPGVRDMVEHASFPLKMESDLSHHQPFTHFGPIHEAMSPMPLLNGYQASLDVGSEWSMLPSSNDNDTMPMQSIGIIRSLDSSPPTVSPSDIMTTPSHTYSHMDLDTHFESHNAATLQQGQSFAQRTVTRRPSRAPKFAVKDLVRRGGACHRRRSEDTNVVNDYLLDDTNSAFASIEQRHREDIHPCSYVDDHGKPCDRRFARREHLTRHENSVHNKGKEFIKCVLALLMPEYNGKCTCTANLDKSGRKTPGQSGSAKKKGIGRPDNARDHYLTHLEGKQGRSRNVIVEAEFLYFALAVHMPKQAALWIGSLINTPRRRNENVALGKKGAKPFKYGVPDMDFQRGHPLYPAYLARKNRGLRVFPNPSDRKPRLKSHVRAEEESEYEDFFNTFPCSSDFQTVDCSAIVAD